MKDNITIYNVCMSAAPAGQRVNSFAERCARRASKMARNG